MESTKTHPSSDPLLLTAKCRSNLWESSDSLINCRAAAKYKDLSYILPFYSLWNLSTFKAIVLNTNIFVKLIAQFSC